MYGSDLSHHRVYLWLSLLSKLARRFGSVVIECILLTLTVMKGSSDISRDEGIYYNPDSSWTRAFDILHGIKLTIRLYFSLLFFEDVNHIDRNQCQSYSSIYDPVETSVSLTRVRRTIQVMRYSALILGVGYGMYHQASLTSRQKMARIDREYAHQERLIQQAKAAYANRNVPPENRKGEPGSMFICHHCHHCHLSLLSIFQPGKLLYMLERCG